MNIEDTDKINTVNIIYNYFKNTASQQTTFINILPLTFDNEEHKIKKDIIYEPSKFSLVRQFTELI